MVKAKQKMKIEVNRESLQNASSARGCRAEGSGLKTLQLARAFVRFVTCVVQRTNVNGISASGSPRRNIASGPRISAQRLELALRQVRRQPRADAPT